MRSVKHRKIVETSSFAPFQIKDSFCYIIGFLAFVLNIHKFNGPTAGFACPELFFLASAVVGNHFVRTFKNGLCGTVILFKPYDLCTGEILFKFENISDVRTAPAVNALVIIADNADIAVFIA